MKGRLLIVNPTGLRRYQGLYSGLHALGWRTSVCELEEPPLLDWYAKVLSFRPSLPEWRGNLRRLQNQLCRTPFAFQYRSRLYDRLIAKRCPQFDLVLQTGGLFSHYWPQPRAPYALFCDCTVKLGEGEPLSGVDFTTEDARRRFYDLEGSLYRRAGFVFSTSQLVRRSLIEAYGVNAERAVAVGSAANLRGPETLERGYDGKTILFVGYEFERKGGLVLLEAFREIRRHIEDARLWIVGPPRVDAELPPGAELLGPLTPAALSQAYQRACVLLLPSLFEPFAIAFLEAMDHGLPCVGSDRCAIPEMITDGLTGFVVPAGDAQALARRTLHLLERPALIREMGERARRRVRREFTWRAVARRVDERLVELLASARRPAARTA
jgi:glycosyltransferase involved in cell wall biosynthesis